MTAECDVVLAFSRHELVEDVFVGCKGASVCLASKDVSFTEMTPDEFVDVVVVVNETSGQEIAVHPKLSVELSVGTGSGSTVSAEGSGVAVTGINKVIVKREYTAKEPILEGVLNPTRTEASWYLRLDRGDTVVRRMMFGNRKLHASAECHLPSILLSTSVKPTGRMFLDSDFNTLNVIGRIALWAKLSRRGVALPRFEPLRTFCLV
jgi:hypothetical protein